MKTHLARGAISLTLSSCIFLVSGYLINIFLGRSLGPVLYGTYGLVIALWSAVNLILTAGLPNVVSKQIASDKSKSEEILKTALSIQFISIVVITGFYFLAADTLSSLFQDSSLASYIRLSSFIFPFYGMYSLYLGYYNGLHNFSRQAVMSIIYSVAKVICVAILAYFFSLNGAFTGFIIAPFVVLLFTFHFPHLKKPMHLPYKTLVIFSLPFIGLTLFSTLQQSIDLFFVKALVKTKEAAGYYTASQNIARIPFFSLSAFSLVLFPGITRSVSENAPERTRRLIAMSLRVILLLLIPGILLISATSHQLIQLLFSNAYIPAASTLSILIFGFGFLTILSILTSILNGSGATIVSLVIAGIGVLACVPFSIVLIPLMGIQGAAVATTGSAVLATCLAAFIVYRRFHVLVSLWSLIKIIGSSLVLYIAAFYLPVPLFLLPLLYVCLFALYIIFLVVLKEITIDDWHFITRFRSL